MSNDTETSNTAEKEQSIRKVASTPILSKKSANRRARMNTQNILMMATWTGYFQEDRSGQVSSLRKLATSSGGNSATDDGVVDESDPNVGKAKTTSEDSEKLPVRVARVLVAFVFILIGIGFLSFSAFQILRPKCGAVSDKWRQCIFHASPIIPISECPCVIYSDTCGAQIERVPRHPVDRFACHKPTTARQWRETSAFTVINGARVFVPGWKRTCDSNSDCNTFSYCTNQRVCEFCVGCSYLQNSISVDEQCNSWCGQVFSQLPLTKVDFVTFKNTEDAEAPREIVGLGQWCKLDFLNFPVDSYEAYARANIIKPYATTIRRCEAGLYCAPSSSASVEVLDLLGNPNGDHAFRCEKCSRCALLFDQCPECEGEEVSTAFVGCFQPVSSLDGEVEIVSYESVPQCSAVAKAKAARYFAVRTLMGEKTKKECLVFPSRDETVSTVDMVDVRRTQCTLVINNIIPTDTQPLVMLYSRGGECDATAKALCTAAHRKNCVVGSESMQCGQCLSGFVADPTGQSNTCAFKMSFSADWTSPRTLHCKLKKLVVLVQYALREMIGSVAIYVRDLRILAGGGVGGVGGDGHGEVDIAATGAVLNNITAYFESGSKLNVPGVGSLSLAQDVPTNVPTTSPEPSITQDNGAQDNNNTCLRQKYGWAEGHSCDRFAAWCDDAVLGSDLRECCPSSCAAWASETNSKSATDECAVQTTSTAETSRRCPHNAAGKLAGVAFPAGTCDSALANSMLVNIALTKANVRLSCEVLERKFLWDCAGCECAQTTTNEKSTTKTSRRCPQNPSGELMGLTYPAGTCDSALANSMLVNIALTKANVRLSCEVLERYFLWDCAGCECGQLTATAETKASRSTTISPPSEQHPQLSSAPSPSWARPASEQRPFGEIIHDLYEKAAETLIIFKMKVVQQSRVSFFRAHND